MAATNFYEKLDEAMIRAGRIDEKIEMQNPTKENAKEMLIEFTTKEKVQPLNAKDAEMAYDKFFKKLKEDKVNQFMMKNSMQWNLLGRTEEELKRLAEKMNADIRPSAADLRDYSEKLISTAYYRNSFEDEDGKILISQDVINEVCG